MEQDTYNTKTLNIAAYLYTCGLQLVSTSKAGTEIFFHFAPEWKAQELVDAYFSDTASVNPKKLFACLNDLRDLIFSNSNKTTSLSSNPKDKEVRI